MRQVTLTKPSKDSFTYARHIRPTDVMPAVADVRELHDLPGTQLDLRRKQVVDLQSGDFVVYGEQERYGYSLYLYGVDEQDRLWTLQADADLKSVFRWWASRGVDRVGDAKLTKAGRARRGCVLKEDLRGKGAYAAFARVIVANRGGMTLAQLVRSWAAAERLPVFKAALERIRRAREAVRAQQEYRAREAARLDLEAQETAWASAWAVDGATIEQLVF